MFHMVIWNRHGLSASQKNLWKCLRLPFLEVFLLYSLKQTRPVKPSKLLEELLCFYRGRLQERVWYMRFGCLPGNCNCFELLLTFWNRFCYSCFLRAYPVRVRHILDVATCTRSICIEPVSNVYLFCASSWTTCEDASILAQNGSSNWEVAVRTIRIHHHS